jgi:hypothetical protein
MRLRGVVGLALLAGCSAVEEPRDYGEPPVGCETVGFAGNDVSIGDYVGERILVFGTSNW